MKSRNPQLWGFPERDAIVQLPDTVLQGIKGMAIDAFPNETGGTLIGYYSDNRRIAHIRRALNVQVGGASGETWFYRPPDTIDDQLERVYKKSRGRLHYLGEWHTHPSASSMPSITDIRSLYKLANEPEVATDTPILFILGGDFERRPSITCVLIEKSGQCHIGIAGQVE